jgi:hypothetical protein
MRSASAYSAKSPGRPLRPGCLRSPATGHDACAEDATDWIPFIEPTDDIRRVDGRLVEIDCTDSTLRLAVETGAGRFVVAVPDRSHVQMRNAPAEFVCGPQSPAQVAIQYAAGSGIPADGVARSITFR